MDGSRFSRRDMVRALGVGGLLAGLGGSVGRASPAMAHPAEKIATPGKPRRVARFAHVTDVHVDYLRGADQGMASCLRHLQGQKDAPQFILNTGDCIYDSMERDDARTGEQWRLWSSIVRQESSLPFEHCIGNHDVWGIDKKKSRTTGSEPLYGKLRAMDVLGLDRRYRSFDRNGWHFVVLDSTLALDGTYAARLDEEQFAWLESDLAGTRLPVVVASHIPILSAAAFFSPWSEHSGNFVVPGNEMHTDFRRLKALFKRHPNVRLCLSGHLHLNDKVTYNDVTYVCGGAVCGYWWAGKHEGDCDAGYNLIDLYDDGTFGHEYVTYGWVPRIPGAQGVAVAE